MNIMSTRVGVDSNSESSLQSIEVRLSDLLPMPTMIGKEDKFR